MSEPKDRVSRRNFLKGVGTGVAGAGAVAGTAVPLMEETAQAAETGAVGPGPVPIELRVNGKTYHIEAEPRETLLDVLRNKLDITGAKQVCNMANCGACTVYLDGKTVNACMLLAVRAQGKEITTIEGLPKDNGLHPVQKAFIDADAMQCGFCTPGFVMSMAAVFEKNPNASLIEIKEGIAGHICRCGTYTQIFHAADLVKQRHGG